jgi:2-octaprenyl-6-methoxyphenol hydroxylase
MVPKPVLAAALHDALAGAVDFIAPVEVTGFSGDGPLAHIHLKDGRAIAAPLVVAADGAMSALRGMAGIGVITHDYRQRASSPPSRTNCLMRARPTSISGPAGPFASLPLPGQALIAGLDRDAGGGGTLSRRCRWPRPLA